MAEADGARQTTASQTAAALAPEAYTHAEKVRRDAEAAYQAGDLSGAQIIGERALAAYQHAVVLGRIAYATDAANRARLALRTAEQGFAETDGEQKRVSAQADDLEIRIKVIKDAAPIVPTGPADAGRENARWNAARSLALDARLLCAAARMLSPDAQGLSAAQDLVGDLEQRLGNRAQKAPLEPAMRARAACLAALTAARRPASSGSGYGRSDQLLSELSAAGALAPVRDDRGVVVTLRKIFSATELTKDGRDQVEALGRVAQAHSDFPVQVVVHAAGSKVGSSLGKGSTNIDHDRGESVAKALAAGGAAADRILVQAAGTAHPVLDPALARDPARNERVEIIFVDPGG